MDRAPNNSALGKDALQPAADLAKPRTESGKIGRITKTMLAAIVAAAPQLSCSGDFEESVDEDIPTEMSEAVAEAKGEAMVFLDSEDNWYFQGTFPDKFRLKVYASKNLSKTVPEPAENELIFEDTIETGAKGAFRLHDYSGSSETVWIVVRAYNPQTGEEIEMGPDPGPEGIKCMPFARNYKGLDE